MKALPALALCMLQGPLCAQPVIDHAGLASFGLRAAMYTLADPAQLPAVSDGADQTWDLTGIALQHLGSLHFRPAAGTAYSEVFPDANWAYEQTFDGLGVLFQYMRINDGSIQIFGRNIPYNPVVYYQPSTVLRFPLAFNEAFTDTYLNEGGPNTRTWTYSGHGTILSSLGTFTNVAKVGNSSGDIILWNLDPLYPIFYLEEGRTYVFKLTAVDTGTGVEEQGEAAVRTWPNPCRERLSIGPARPGSRWQMKDLQGRLLLGGLADAGELNIDVRGLASGSYVLLLADGGRQLHLPFVKE